MVLEGLPTHLIAVTNALLTRFMIFNSMTAICVDCLVHSAGRPEMRKQWTFKRKQLIIISTLCVVHLMRILAWSSGQGIYNVRSTWCVGWVMHKYHFLLLIGDMTQNYNLVVVALPFSNCATHCCPFTIVTHQCLWLYIWEARHHLATKWKWL